MYHGKANRPSTVGQPEVSSAEGRSARRASPVVGRPEVLRSRPELEAVWAQAEAMFPVRVTRSYWERMNLKDPNDPLALQALPHPGELVEHPEDLDDPVGDAACSPVPWVVHKYPNRVLVLLTKRCHLYCRYCFRRGHNPGLAEDPDATAWARIWRYVAKVKPQEVILSGGDPLAVRDERLFEAVDRARAIAPVVRVHTRAPITRPDRVTQALVEGLAARGPVWITVHCNHPAELSPEVDQALARLVDAGVPVLNQAVLLRGVNDDPQLLAALCDALVTRRVFPYYLHHTDRARGNAHLRVSRAEGLRLYDALRGLVSGVALPRYVEDPPEGTGKVDVRRVAERDLGV